MTSHYCTNVHVTLYCVSFETDVILEQCPPYEAHPALTPVHVP